MPKNTRLLSSLHASAAAIADDPSLREAVRLRRIEDDRLQRRSSPSLIERAGTSGNAISTLSFSRIFSTSQPLERGDRRASSFHARRLYFLASLSSVAVRPLRVSKTNRPLPSLTAASTVYASSVPLRLNAMSPTLPSSW